MKRKVKEFKFRLKQANSKKEEENEIRAIEKEASLRREEAIQVGERIKAEIEAKGGNPTKEEILKCLAEDCKENQLYKTWISILCSNGVLLQEENELDR